MIFGPMRFCCPWFPVDFLNKSHLNKQGAYKVLLQFKNIITKAIDEISQKGLFNLISVY